MCQFSVIVPVYNIEKYIGECIESVLNQSYREFELILVDDGSTDLSGEIIDRYANENENVISIHQKNKGPGAARNSGLKVAKGKYILFADGDDFYSSKDSFLEIFKTLEKQTNIDMIVYTLKSISDRTKIVSDSTVNYKDDLNHMDDFYEVLRNLNERGTLLSSPCELCLSRKFILDHDLYFLEGIFSEDIEWWIRIFLAKPKCFFINKHLYCYRFDREGSTCNTAPVYAKTKKIIQFINDYYLKLSSDMHSEIIDYLAYHWCVQACNVARSKCNHSEKKDLYNELKKSVHILKNNRINKVRIFYKFNTIFGLVICANLSAYYYNRKRKRLKDK